MFAGTGLLPATIIYVATAQIEPGQNAHLETLMGYGIVTALTAFLTAMFSFHAVKIWRTCEEKHNQSEKEDTTN